MVVISVLEVLKKYLSLNDKLLHINRAIKQRAYFCVSITYVYQEHIPTDYIRKGVY